MKSNQTSNLDQTATGVPVDVFSTLVETLGHSDPTLRQGAIREFAKRKDKRGVAPLVEMLCDEDINVRLDAAKALGEFGWRPSEDAQRARYLIALQDFQSVGPLGEAALNPTMLLLSDDAASMRMVGLEVISRIGGPSVIVPLIEALKDDCAQVRAVAAQCLSVTQAPEALDALRKLVRDSSWEVRSVALDALEGYDGPAKVDAIGGFLRDHLVDLRLRAVELLGRTGDLRAIKHLVSALIDNEAAVRSVAEQNLKNLDANWEKTEYAKGAAPSLLPALKHENDAIRETAANTLRSVGHIRAMNSYLTAESAITSHSPLPIFENALKAANRDLRQAAAEALGKISDPGAKDLLVTALRDDDAFVREAALYSLNLLNWKPANDAEVVLKAVILQRWDTAVLFDSLAFEPLVMVLDSDDVEVCKSAIGSLAQIGDKRATEPLSQMLEHPRKPVRMAAAQALAALDWLPNDARKGVRQAIELGDWTTVAQHGAVAVEPLIATIKENYDDEALRTAAGNALAAIADTEALKPLMAHSRDGQLAEIIVAALANVLEHHVAEVPSEHLQALTTLNNIFQFRYAFDARYGKFVRSGLQEVDTARLKKVALQELARRGEA